MPATPPSTPPPSLPSVEVTPPTSPQLAQQAAHHEEHNLHTIGSPEQCRTPAIPSAPGPSALATLDGQIYHHLPANLAAQLAALPPMPTRHLRQPTSLAGPPQILTSAELAAAHTSLPSFHPQPNIRQPIFVSSN
jgi:hypothetical protein